MKLVSVVVLASLLGCTKPNAASCSDHHCNDPNAPFCDVDGTIGGAPDTCIAVDCTAGEFEACQGDRALVCNSFGDNYDVVECEFGCSADARGCNVCNTTECEKHIIPRYLPTVCDELSPLPALTISSNTALDTNDDSMCTSVVMQQGAPDICVQHYGTITIERNQTYSVTGTRALALIADRELLVDGVLDVSANRDVDGPGGGFVQAPALTPGAGGGAGYRTPGGSAGSTSTDGGAANAGPALTHPNLLAELYGGTRAAPALNPGGGGGGASTLISCRGKVGVVGLIDAGGGGGHEGVLLTVPTTKYFFATGGGSGGTVVLQGLQVEVYGEIYANGGSGGGGGTAQVSGPNGAGVDGTRSTSPAPGGAAQRTNDGAGGAGGTSLYPGDGKKPAGAGGEPGGGGGASGFILVYTPKSAMPTLTPIAVSPEFEPVGTLATN